MGKLILISLLVSVAVAELNLFPDNSAFVDGIYDEDTLTAQIFGTRHRRDAEEDDDICGVKSQNFWGLEEMNMMEKPRKGHPHPPPRPDRKDSLPPNGDSERFMCPPPPPPPPSTEESPTDDGSQRKGAGPPTGHPPHGRPGGGPGGPGGPGRHGPHGRKLKMVRCCDTPPVMDPEMYNITKKCREEMKANMAEKDQRGPRRGPGCGPRWQTNITQCMMMNLNMMSGEHVDGSILIKKVKSISNLGEHQAFYVDIIEKHKSGKTVTEFVKAISVDIIANCPAGSEAKQCTEQCAEWKKLALSLV